MLGVFGSMVCFRLGKFSMLMGQFQIVFQLVIVALIIANVYDRPYRAHSEVLNRLIRDGIISFLVCCSHLTMLGADRRFRLFP